MTGSVTKLQPDRQDYEQAGCDVHFETTIGEGRVLRLSTTFFQGTPLETQKKVTRDILSIADAEKASYELGDLRWQLRLKEKGLKRCEEDVARIDGQNEKRKAELKVEIEAMGEQRTERALAHEQAFRATGRQGNFKRSSQQMTELSSIERDIGKLQAELSSIDTATTAERRDTLTALQRIRIDIQETRDEINRRLFILGLPEE